MVHLVAHLFDLSSDRVQQRLEQTPQATPAMATTTTTSFARHSVDPAQTVTPVTSMATPRAPHTTALMKSVTAVVYRYRARVFLLCMSSVLRGAYIQNFHA